MVSGNTRLPVTESLVISPRDQPLESNRVKLLHVRTSEQCGGDSGNDPRSGNIDLKAQIARRCLHPGRRLGHAGPVGEPSRRVCGLAMNRCSRLTI